MKKKFLAICAAAFLFASCSNEKTEGESTSKDSSGKDTKMEKMDDNSKKEQAWIPVDPAAAQAAMMKNAELGEPHKMMAKSNGTWNAEVTYWAGIDSAAVKSTGTAVNSMILDGHFQQSTFSGDMMGMPFKGVSTVGYDNTTKEYVSTWIESMSTSMMIMRGTWDNATNSMTMTGKQKNPVNGLECSLREVYKIVDDNTQVMEMYGPDAKTGKEYKMMEIKYTRKK